MDSWQRTVIHTQVVRIRFRFIPTECIYASRSWREMVGKRMREEGKCERYVYMAWHGVYFMMRQTVRQLNVDCLGESNTFLIHFEWGN